jgi:hypothetical protein
MPPQNRVWRHNRGHLAQRLAPETLSTRPQPAPLIIREPHPSAAQLGPQDSMLFHQIRDHVMLVLIEPAGEGGEEERKRRDGYNHGSDRLLP